MSGGADTSHRQEHCSRCGVPLGRRGKCPALCEPVPSPPPVYVGPAVVGQTHIGRMARADVLGTIPASVGGAPNL